MADIMQANPDNEPVAEPHETVIYMPWNEVLAP